ncbi:MAG: efflux RND transporter permease subunit [Cellvibrionaceae bacterium]
MSPLSIAISRFRTTICVMVFIFLAGIMARSIMPIESSPKVNVPMVYVGLFQEGISPEDAVRLLVRPLEQELRSIDGVEEIIATSRENSATVLIEFDMNNDIDKAVNDVREAVDRARSRFPADAEEPVVSEVSAQPFPTIVVTLSGDDVQERLLFNTAQRIKRDIENVSDVLDVNMAGHREEVAEAVIDPDKLEFHGITSGDLVAALRGNNLLVPAGEIDTGKGRFSVKVPGLIETVKDVYQLPLKSSADGVVTLGQVAEIRRTFKDRKSFTSIDGKSAIALEVVKRTEANEIAVAEAVRGLVESEIDTIPEGIAIKYVFDQSKFSRQLVSELQGNIITAMMLVMVVVVAALGVRSGLLVGLGIPFSLLIGTMVCYYLGYSFNFMVLFGMLLALGMLIDGCLVVTEFADRKMAEGEDSRTAYQTAVKRMFWPVLSSTGTTLAAFTPILFWPGVPGDFMGYLPVTVFAVLIGSLFYALLFAPALGAYVGGSSKQQHQVVNEDDIPDMAHLDKGAQTYARVLEFVTQRPIKTAATSVAVLFLIFEIYGRFNAGVEFFTETEEAYGSVIVRAQGNYSIDEIEPLVKEVEERVLSVPGVLRVYTRSGGGGISGNRETSKDEIATMMVELTEVRDRELGSKETFALIRAATADLPGIYVSADQLESGPPVGKPVQVQLASRDPERLRAVTAQVKEHFMGVSGLRDVEDTLPLPGIEWELEVDRAEAALYGLDVLQVGYSVQLVTNGMLLGEYRPDDADEEVDIRVRFTEKERGLDGLKTLRINTPHGPVPISQFVRQVPKPKVDSIQRIDGVEVKFVKANVEDGVLADDKVKEIQQWLDVANLDPNVDVSFRGANEEQAESAAFLGVAFLLALFLMFILLVAQFNSFYQAFLVLSAVIMSTAGVLLGLTLTQETFSVIMTGVGIVALAGIVVNNNIVLIDTYNHLRDVLPEYSPPKLVVMAGAQRLRPVLLTTVTTVLGLLPIAMHTSIDLVGRNVEVGGVVASMWVPLASAIVYGLVFSTVLTLIVTPALLLLPYQLKKYLGRRKVSEVGLEGA